MDEISQEQPSPQEPKLVSPNGGKNGLLQELEFGVGGMLLGVGTFLLMLFLLNYFNIVSLSLVFPKYFGFLPNPKILIQCFYGNKKALLLC